MPKRNYKKGKKSKRSHNRGKVIKYPKMNINSMMLSRGKVTNLPDRMFTKLKYVDNNLNFINIKAVGQCGKRTFRLNSCYDPDLSLGNYGCYGYNEWASFYNKYRVRASKIKVRFTQKIESTGVGEVKRYRCTVLPSDLDLPSVTQQYVRGLAMAPYSKTTEVSTFVGSRTSATVQNYMTVNKFEGSKCPEYDITYAANTYGNGADQTPKNQTYWIIVANCVDGNLTNDYQLGCQVEITYYVEFYCRKDLGPSISGPEGPTAIDDTAPNLTNESLDNIILSKL